MKNNEYIMYFCVILVGLDTICSLMGRSGTVTNVSDTNNRLQLSV